MRTNDVTDALHSLAGRVPAPSRPDSTTLDGLQRARRRQIRTRGFAVAAVCAALATAVVASRPDPHRSRIVAGSSTPATVATTTATTTTTAPVASLCRFAHVDLYTLRSPIEIELPISGRRPTPIVAGDPLTRPNAVTLDGDGSTDPGQLGYAQGAATGLWGSDALGGPFAGIERIVPGQIVTIRQSGPTACTQRWRVVNRGKPERAAPLQLVLIGFTPSATGLGPHEDHYVTAVPAPNG